MGKVIYKGYAKKDSPIYTGKYTISSKNYNQESMMSMQNSEMNTDLNSTKKSTQGSETEI